MSDSLQLRGLQHARLPCPSLSPGLWSNSCPLRWWCQPNISSCFPLLLLPSIFPRIRVFSNESALHIGWPKYWSFSFSISPSNEYSGFISFRNDIFDLLDVQRTLKNLLQHHSSKASIAQHSAFFYGPTHTFVYYYWRWWHPTPVLLPRKSHGRRSLVGCGPWSHEESDTTERLHFHFSLSYIGEGNGNPLQCFAWRIPGMGEPGGLPSMGSHRVGHNWSDLAAATGKTIALTIWTFVSKVMSLLFNTLSRFVIAFPPRSKHLLISWVQSLFMVILEPKKLKSPLFPRFPHLFAMKWWDQMP